MFTLAKEAFAEELGRWTRIEEKAGRFLTVIGLMFAVFTWVGQVISTKILPPQNWVEWALGLVMACLFVSLGGAGWFSFQALRLGQLSKMALDKSVFLDQSLADAYMGYADKFIEELKRNRETCKPKTENLQRAYTCIQISFALAFLAGILVTANLWQQSY